MSIIGWIGVIALIGFATFIWLQVKAAGKAEEVVRNDTRDLEAAVRIAEATNAAPSDKQSILDRLRGDSKRKL